MRFKIQEFHMSDIYTHMLTLINMCNELRGEILLRLC